jgi:hypothetical protein
MTSPISNQIDSVSCGIHVVAFTLTRLTGQSTSDYDSVYMWHRFGLKWTMRSVIPRKVSISHLTYPLVVLAV